MRLKSEHCRINLFQLANCQKMECYGGPHRPIWVRFSSRDVMPLLPDGKPDLQLIHDKALARFPKGGSYLWRDVK
jgi:hypothetical protein